MMSSSSSTAVARSQVRAGVGGSVHGLSDGRRGFWVRWQPWRCGTTLFGVVVAEDAADVSIVFGVAVGFGGEECGADGGDLGGGFGEDVGVPG